MSKELEGSVNSGVPTSPSTVLKAGNVQHIEELDNLSEYLVPNRWWKYRQALREYAAEFAGVMLVIIFGDGVVCQVVLSSNTNVTSSPKGEYLSISFGWAIGVAIGVWVSGGISGAHLNPAVTISLATFRGFPWKKVPGYCFAQLMGGLVGAAIIYANYFHAIDIFEGGKGIRTLKTAGLFSTYALDYMTTVSCFFSEFFASAILLIAIFAFIDNKNLSPPRGVSPVALFILILGIGACLGMETGYAINPARDLGPRLLTSMVGYGTAVYSFRNQYWLWCPVIAPIFGALFGAFLYDLFLYDGDDNIIYQWFHSSNRKLATRRRSNDSMA